MSRKVWTAGGIALCFWVVSLSFRPSHFRGTTLSAAPRKLCAFLTNYHACIAMLAWCSCAPSILFWPWPPYNLIPRSCLTSIFFVDPHWWVPLCVQPPANAMPFQQIVMHALQCKHDVDVHLLFYFDLDLLIACFQGHVKHRFYLSIFWPWPPYDLFSRSCLTWIFFINLHGWILLCVQRPTKAMAFQQIIMHVLQFPHDVDVHILSCFNLDLYLSYS